LVFHIIICLMQV